MNDYSVYILNKKEELNYYLCACSALAFLGLLFYRSFIMALLCAACARFLKCYYEAYMGKKRRERLLEGFRDVLYCISSSVAAGRQMPSALADAAAQMEISYGKDSDISRELGHIVSVYRGVHGDPARLLTDFGERSGLPEIIQFAASYRICERSGGNLEDVCLKSANLLLDRLAFQWEVKSLTAQKKLDMLMLLSLPVIMLTFLNLVSYDYLSLLYEGFAGRLIMSGCLLTIGGALLWSLKILRLEL